MNRFMTGGKAIPMQILILPPILLVGPLSHHKFRLPLPITNVCSSTNLKAHLCSGELTFLSLTFTLKKKISSNLYDQVPVSMNSVMLADIFFGNTNPEG